MGSIQKKVEDAVQEVDAAKKKASRISVDSAQRQFMDAAENLTVKSRAWMAITIALFAALAAFLWWNTRNPPPLISHIVDAMESTSKSVALPVSVPLLVAASAYFTGLRLAFIGVLGIGLAFSLRMTRAYLHLIEHNHHKLRVTNSIEAFVAAVRTDEQKDLVLSKFVESVTEFGDSGILGKEAEASGLPTVIFEAMTKNVGKST